jgi:muramoyltetrapeptide carboxypeptidase
MHHKFPQAEYRVQRLLYASGQGGHTSSSAQWSLSDAVCRIHHGVLSIASSPQVRRSPAGGDSQRGAAGTREFLERGESVAIAGYDVEVPTGYDQRWGYLAGEDAQRRQQLLDGLKDPDCKGILCARGGFGGSRLLEDWQWPDVPPKWLVGFSDITSLLWSLAKSGIAGVHGPLLTTLEIEPAWSQQRLFDWIEGRAVPPIQGLGWVGGQVTAPLLPANLTVATHLLGTAHEPDLAGVILAFEDVTEAPYRIDRMLTHWRMMGKLAAVKGLPLVGLAAVSPLTKA